MSATNHAQLIKADSIEYITTALLQLIEKNKYSTITVTQVVKRAGVSRMAFYRNFETLDDVLLQYFSPIIEAKFNDVINQISSADKLTSLSIFFTEFSDTLKLSISNDFEFIIKKIFNSNMIRFYNTTQLWQDKNERLHSYYVNFMIAGIYSIWRDWLLTGQKESLIEIHALIADIQNSLI